MFKLTTLASVAALALAYADHPVTEEIVQEIKEKTTQWIPMEVDENPFKDMDHVQIFGLLGTVYRPAYGNMQPAPENIEVPDNFDSREKWPKCIHGIRDQQKCGSCWAFGASEALSDRFCIASKKEINVVLSP